MPFDKWGLSFLYPTATSAGITGTGTAFFYQQSDDITDDEPVPFSGEGHVSGSGGGQWTMSTSGPDAVQIAKNSTSASVGCGVKFTDLQSRGYAYKADDPRDIELKFLVKFVSSGSDNGFAIESSTGEHSSSGCCSGYSYKVDIQYRPSQPVFRFRKEMWHVSNSDDPVTGSWTSPLFNFQLLGHGSWVGFAFIRYNKKDGVSTGKDSVVLEFWGNPDPDNNPQNWTLLKRTEDKGGWGNDGDHCNGAKDQVGTWSVEKYRLKSNDSSGEFNFKHLSLREIDPTKSFDDNPNPPPPDQPPSESTSELQGLFKFQWDINTLRTSPCAGTGTGGGGGSGAAKFYEITDTSNIRELSDSSTYQHRTGVVEQATSSLSPMVGKTLIQLDVPLKKSGSPGASPVVEAKILDSALNVVYTSPTTFDPSTFTTSYATKTFDFSSNTHTFVNGDMVGVFYTGTSSSNYVLCAYQDSDTIVNSVYSNIESGAQDIKPSREFTCTMWQ